MSCRWEKGRSTCVVYLDISRRCCDVYVPRLWNAGFRWVGGEKRGDRPRSGISQVGRAAVIRKFGTPGDAEICQCDQIRPHMILNAARL